MRSRGVPCYALLTVGTPFAREAIGKMAGQNRREKGKMADTNAPRTPVEAELSSASPVGFIPAGSSALASSRFLINMIYQRLSSEQPHFFHLLRRPTSIRKRLGLAETCGIFATVLRRGIRIVVFQKVKGTAPVLMALLKLAGRRVIYVESDWRRRVGFARNVDAFVAPSRRLAQDLHERTGVPAYYIPDPVEYWNTAALEEAWRPKDRYRTLWIGHRKNWHQIEALKAELEAKAIHAFDVITVSNHPDADISWSLAAVERELQTADLGIIPVTDDLRSSMKSENRAALFMAAGIPVIVSQSPVYEGLVEDGRSGFVYRDIDDLKTLPERLRTTELVQAIRAEAMARVKVYSIDEIASRWRQLLSAGV